MKLLRALRPRGHPPLHRPADGTAGVARLGRRQARRAVRAGRSGHPQRHHVPRGGDGGRRPAPRRRLGDACRRPPPGRALVRDDVPEPVPEFGTVLVEVKACGICGSDLHFAKHGADDARPRRGDGRRRRARASPELDLDRDVYMGHEFTAEVLEVGPDTVGPAPGTIVTSIPVAPDDDRRPPRSSTATTSPRGYGERMLLSAPMLVEVPNGLDPGHAALTEPMAVGLHAVNRVGDRGGRRRARARLRSGRPRRDRRAAHAAASSRSSPRTCRRRRRALAATMGADEVVDPVVEPAFEAWGRAGGGAPLVVFEAIGVPGIIDHALQSAPTGIADRRRRRVHGARHDHAVLRDRQGAVHPVRARLRPDGVRRQPAIHRRGRRST